MHIVRQLSIRIAFLLLPGIILWSCDRTRSMRGYDFMPDMVYSQAYDTYSKNPNFNDTITMRVPVKETVPRGFTPFRYTIEPESRIKAGKDLLNPFLPSDEVIEAGKLVFTTFCIGCHGESGGGDGQLYSSGLYPVKPREISGEVAFKLKDGEIYHTITLGFGPMGPHGAQIKPEDRWKLVHYVRKLQKDAQNKRDTISKGNKPI